MQNLAFLFVALILGCKTNSLKQKCGALTRIVLLLEAWKQKISAIFLCSL